MAKKANVERDANAQQTVALIAGDNRPELTELECELLGNVGGAELVAAESKTYKAETVAATCKALLDNGHTAEEWFAPKATGYPSKDDPMFLVDKARFQAKQLAVATGAYHKRVAFLQMNDDRPMPESVLKNLEALLFVHHTATQQQAQGFNTEVQIAMTHIKKAMNDGMRSIREGLVRREKDEQTDAQREASILFASYRKTAAKEDMDAEEQTEALDHLVAYSHICGFHHEFMALVDNI